MNKRALDTKEFIDNYKKQREISPNKHYNLDSIRSAENYNSFPR